MPKQIIPLTDAKIKAAKPKSTEYKIFDGGGLYVLVTPSGGKLWRLKYRAGGKEKKLTLGSYPEISLAEARQKRDQARALLASGTDLATAKKKEKAKADGTNSFEAVAREWHNRFKTEWSVGHAEAVLTRLSKDVFPHIGNREMDEVTPPEMLAVLRRIEDRSLETAHRAKITCGQIYRYAIAIGKATYNPVDALRGALPPVRPKHMAAPTDPKEIAPILRMIDGYTGSFIVACALKLAPLVFVRPGELRQAEWAGIDLDLAEWRYTVTKTKTEHLVPLSRQAVAILKEIHPVTGDGRYVFPSARTAARPMSEAAINAALRRMGIDTKEELTGHGFRAMARTILDEVLGFRPDLIEHQLAHAVRDPLGRAYNRTTHLPERKKMMQAWADYLDKLKAGAKVIAFRQAAG